MGARVVASILLLAFAGHLGPPATASGGAGRGATLRILSYNIHHGAGNDEVLDLERIARLIRSLDPHLVALQEMDNGTERTGGVDQAAELGRLTGMTPVFGKFMDYSTPDSAVMALIRETFTIPDKGDDHFTFPSHEADREIDFLAWRPGDRFAVVESRVIDEPVASDHRPVFLVIETR